MSEYITRERALEILNDIGGCGAEPGSYMADWDEAINAAYEAIQDEPAADVAPVVHGEWITIDGISRCSECGYIPAYDSAIDDLFYSPFCPNCGAKMDEDN
mgnify:CR=1 FL=1